MTATPEGSDGPNTNTADGPNTPDTPAPPDTPDTSGTPETPAIPESERTITSSVEVGVPPAVAFEAFTREMDSWWVRGPINAFDSSRALAMVCESGVGGRLLEVYDAETGEGLELGRITVWEPGVRMAWTSSLDDVFTAVSFEPSAGGTTVTVTATIAASGRDQGGTAWVRTIPRWFPAWCARRDLSSTPQPPMARLGVGIRYRRPAAAARWLATAFGLRSPDPLPTGEDPLPHGEYGHPWIEFRAGNASVIVLPLSDGDSDDREPPGRHETWVYVDDLEAHLDTARQHGATILGPITHTGFRSYPAADLEGNHWVFLQATPAQ